MPRENKKKGQSYIHYEEDYSEENMGKCPGIVWIEYERMGQVYETPALCEQLHPHMTKVKVTETEEKTYRDIVPKFNYMFLQPETETRRAIEKRKGRVARRQKEKARNIEGGLRQVKEFVRDFKKAQGGDDDIDIPF
jgi:hypothetical protein